MNRFLDRIDWDSSGWPVVNKGHGPSGNPSGLAEQKRAAYADKFTEQQLDAGWRWPIGHEPIFAVGQGTLRVHAAEDGTPVLLGLSLTTPAFVSTVRLQVSSAAGGLGVLGGAHTALVLSRTGRTAGSGARSGRAKGGAVERSNGFRRSYLAPSCRGGQCLRGVQLQHGRRRLDSDSANSKHRSLPALGSGPGAIGVVVSGKPGTEASFRQFNLSADAK